MRCIAIATGWVVVLPPQPPPPLLPTQTGKNVEEGRGGDASRASRPVVAGAPGAGEDLEDVDAELVALKQLVARRSRRSRGRGGVAAAPAAEGAANAGAQRHAAVAVLRRGRGGDAGLCVCVCVCGFFQWVRGCQGVAVFWGCCGVVGCGSVGSGWREKGVRGARVRATAPPRPPRPIPIDSIRPCMYVAPLSPDPRCA